MSPLPISPLSGWSPCRLQLSGLCRCWRADRQAGKRAQANPMFACERADAIARTDCAHSERPILRPARCDGFACAAFRGVHAGLRVIRLGAGGGGARAARAQPPLRPLIVARFARSARSQTACVKFPGLTISSLTQPAVELNWAQFDSAIH